MAQTLVGLTEQFICQRIVNEGLVCVAFRNVRPLSFCRLRRQIPKTRVASRLDNVAFAAPPDPKSGKLCPIVTQFRIHSEYFDSNPQRDLRTMRIPRAGHAEESCLSPNKGSPQSLDSPDATKSCVFNNIPVL